MAFAISTILTVTSDLVRRVDEHKNGVISGFCQKHDVHSLVHYERHETIGAAITREKQIKKWKREWKIELIETDNPGWDDLACNG